MVENADRHLDNLARQKAEAIENKLIAHDYKGAEAKFEKDYQEALSTMSPAQAKKMLASERDALKRIDKDGYNLILVEWAKREPDVVDDHTTRRDLKFLGRLPENPTAHDRYEADNARDLAHVYGKLVGGFRHVVLHHLNPANWQGGFRDWDLNRVEEELRHKVEKHATASVAAKTFMANNGELFDKIAGDRGTIDRDTLKSALNHNRFSGDEKQAVKWMYDHWYDPSVNQLKNGHMHEGDYLRIARAALPPVGAYEGATHGWNHGKRWGGWLGGVLEGAAGAVVGLTGVGGAIIEGYHRHGNAGELTKRDMLKAIASNLHGSEEAHPHHNGEIAAAKKH